MGPCRSRPRLLDATWIRTLRNGTSGSDVAQVQIRVAGWTGYGVNTSVMMSP